MKRKAKIIKIIDLHCESTFELLKNLFSMLKEDLKELNDYKGYDEVGKENLIVDFKYEISSWICDLKEIISRKIDNIQMKTRNKKEKIIKEVIKQCDSTIKWLDYSYDEIWNDIKQLETSESDEEKWWFKHFEIKLLHITKELKKSILKSINTIKESSIISITIPSNLSFVCGSCSKIYKGYSEDRRKIKFKLSDAFRDVCEMCYANEYYNSKKPINFDKACRRWHGK